MKWSNTLELTQPLTGVRHITAAPEQDWEERAKEREQKAFERGQADGEKALREQLVQQRNEMAALQRGILESLRRAVPQVMQETEGALLGLALEAARKFVGALPITAELVEAVVRDALGQFQDTAEIIIQIHPEDLKLLQQAEAQILNGGSSSGSLRFIPTAEVTRGGCLIRTRFGVLDARREVKFERLKQTLQA